MKKVSKYPVGWTFVKRHVPTFDARRTAQKVRGRLVLEALRRPVVSQPTPAGGRWQAGRYRFYPSPKYA